MEEVDELELLVERVGGLDVGKAGIELAADLFVAPPHDHIVAVTPRFTDRAAVARRASARSLTPSSMRRVMTNAAGSMMRMPSHATAVFGTCSVPRETSRVR